MNNNYKQKIKQYEYEHPIFKEKGDGNNGYFRIPYENITINLIVSDGKGWDHASVSISDKPHKNPRRLPNWNEMEYVKNIVWDKEETTVQFHPKESEYRTIGPVLHIWKKQGHEYELPNGLFVAPEQECKRC